MANQEHLDILHQGFNAWNNWLWSQPIVIEPDLSGEDFSNLDFRNYHLDHVNFEGATFYKTVMRGVDLRFSNFRGAKLQHIDMRWATLYKADLSKADLYQAGLQGADLRKAILNGSNLKEALLRDANLREADLTNADLTHSDLTNAVIVETNLSNAILSYSYVFGISVWGPNLTNTQQEDLVITQKDEPVITVDDLEIAQFIYLLIDNQKIRRVIDTITSKAVLILGRFTPERKIVLDTLRAELRNYDLVPILFDFDKPTGRNLTETIATLAGMALFVIADLTDPKSIPQELQRIIPDNPSLPVQPIILFSQDPYAMFGDMLDYPWVLIPHRYNTLDELLAELKIKVIDPPVKKAEEIELKRKAFLGNE